MRSKVISPCGTTISLAPGLSSTSLGMEIDVMPSCTVPIFSNKPETSHMIHCDMPHSLSTRPMTTATAPIVTASPSHSQIEACGHRKQQQRIQHVEQAEQRGDQPHRAVDGVEEAR